MTRFVFTLLIWCLSGRLSAQKTFRVDTALLANLDRKEYKIYIVSKGGGIDFIGREIPLKDRFTPETPETLQADHAIRTLYAEAAIRAMDKQYERIYSDSAERQQAFQNYLKKRPDIFRSLQKDQKNKMEDYDRYFWGYRNADNEKLILIRFDPHQIKYTTISGESLLDVPAIMVYNLDRNSLSYGGFSDYKE